MIVNKITLNQSKNLIVLLSPVLIIIIGHLVAKFFLGFLGKWTWIGYFPVYWGMLILFISLFNEKKNILLWFKKPQGSYWWSLLALGMGLVSFPALFIPNFEVLNSVTLVIVLFGFALINSPLEEAYWRAFLLDKTDRFPRIYGVIYSSILFTIIHPLNLGVFSRIQSFNPGNPFALFPFLVILIVLSLIYCLIYIKTRSLRLPVISHILTDVGNLSVFLFMNMVRI